MSARSYRMSSWLKRNLNQRMTKKKVKIEGQLEKKKKNGTQSTILRKHFEAAAAAALKLNRETRRGRGQKK